MPYTSKEERDLIRAALQRYIRDTSSLTLLQYSRLMLWLNGDSVAAIAEDEGVSAQAVGASVKKTAIDILAWAKADLDDA